METAIQIVELIVFVLMAIFLFYTLTSLIKDKIDERKAQRNFDKTIENISETLIKKISEAKVEIKEEKVTPNVRKTNNKDYDDMSVSELKKIAQKKKIKGYYNLKKEQLVEAIKETEILPE